MREIKEINFQLQNKWVMGVKMYSMVNTVNNTVQGHVHVCILSCFSRVWLFATLWTGACQAPLSTEFSKQEYWSGLPFPSPRDLPNPGIFPTQGRTHVYCLVADSLPTEPPENPATNTIHKDKHKMDLRPKCKARNFKTLRGKHRQNTLWHKLQQDPLQHTC